MMSPVRQQILRELEALSGEMSDMRFGQLIAHLAFLAADPWDQTLWNLEDEELLKAIQQQRADLLRPPTATTSRPAENVLV